MVEQVTLYTNKLSPFAQRVEIALEESGLDYTKYEVDLGNKPDWYTPKVNPTGKVPAITYGGPRVPADEEPSPDSQKIAESLVLVEFIADISNTLLPKDPILRARARLFIDAVSNKLFPAFGGSLFRGESPESILTAIEAIQTLLPTVEQGKYAIGDGFTIADVSIAPFLLRLSVALPADIGPYESGLGKAAWETLQTDAKYTRFRQYLADLRTRESVNKTFDEPFFTSWFKARFSQG